ncbi:hypothetical protein ZEAMMB73_Zm00001d024652 [Zea mays]|uniref:Uncharacterized protein n=1 Tax=Zea mays TaxID=4577 RepID=A0A1D6J0U8_MAIZE|nr:hypothetical protein ZEAMMB73_Zm00001d024652 [Zea mays]
MEAISNTRLALGILVADSVVLVGEKVTSKLFQISRSTDVRRPPPLWDLLLIHKVGQAPRLPTLLKRPIWQLRWREGCRCWGQQPDQLYAELMEPEKHMQIFSCRKMRCQTY